MSLGPRVATVWSYADLIAAFRARMDELQITHATLDAEVPLQPGYASKILCPRPMKILGPQVFGPIIRTLGLTLVVIEDPETAAGARQMTQRLRPLKAPKIEDVSMLPIYRTTAEPTYVNGAPHHAGAEVNFHQWPRESLEPVNEPARRIIAYFQKHRFDGFLPRSPFDADHRRFLLPAHLPGLPTRRKPSLPAAVSPGMPLYRTRIEMPFGHRVVAAGEVIALLAWPTVDMHLVPVNYEAQRVVDYFEINEKNPRLLPAPWDEFEETLFLPDLPAPRVIRREDEPPASRAIATKPPAAIPQRGARRRSSRG